MVTRSGSKVTVARSAESRTQTPSTPGSVRTASSTWATQLAQSIPVTGMSIVVRLATLAIVSSCLVIARAGIDMRGDIGKHPLDCAEDIFHPLIRKRVIDIPA